MASWFHWNNLFTSYLPTLKLFTQRETDVGRPEMFRSFILSRVRPSQRKCGLWWLCKNQKAGSRFEDKGAISRSVPIFTGQFNERPNTTLSLTPFPPPTPPVLVSSWSHEINVEPAVLDQFMYICDCPTLACMCVCVRFTASEHTTGFWRAWCH